jgi:hypothetical protein
MDLSLIQVLQYLWFLDHVGQQFAPNLLNLLKRKYGHRIYCGCIYGECRYYNLDLTYKFRRQIIQNSNMRF